MFAFDQALLPQLTTRRALILVDFQNDFLEKNGALPSTGSEGFVSRALQLVTDFRGKGDVIWIQSQFGQPVPATTESIVVSDTPATRRHKNSRSRGAVSTQSANSDESPDLEAFLSHAEAVCVKPGSWGAKMSSEVEAAVKAEDSVLTKTNYSGFNGTHLLRLLRAKMVMEVFICGSIANVGVHATALDAAGHGMSITVVEDCCGYREEQRQLMAVRSLIELTGCEIASAEEVKEGLQISNTAATSPQPPRPRKAALASSKPKAGSSEKDGGADASEVAETLAGLRLNADETSGSGKVARIDAATAESMYRARSKRQVTSGKESMTKMNNSEKIIARERSTEGNNEISSASKVGGEGEVGPASSTSAPVATAATINTTSPHSQDSTALATTITKTELESQEFPEAAAMELRASTSPTKLCEGDTYVMKDLLPEDLAETAFDRLRGEVQWQHMHHQGGEVPRLVAVQGEVAEDGSMPIYRHPSDESPPLLPFTPTVRAIKAETEKHLGHALNHALIQFYRDGNDYISEHSDKTIDIVKGSSIANVSLGAERTMVFRTKRQAKDSSHGTITPSSPGDAKRQTKRAQLPHNSLCRVGLQTNMKWLHAIRQDKRAERDKSSAELAFSGARISLTFRQIGTFLDREEAHIWGQGATSKGRDAAKLIVNGQGSQATAMLKAFGIENNSSTFDWDAHYGQGFDVLHISSSPRFFASADAITNMRITLMLAEFGVKYAKGSLASSADANSTQNTLSPESPPVRFTDNDENKSTVGGDLAAMLYLDSVYGRATASRASQAELAARLSHFQRALRLADIWRQQTTPQKLGEPLRGELAAWNDIVQGINLADTSASPTVVDFAVWPALHAMVEVLGSEGVFDGLSDLKGYYDSFAQRESTKQVLRE